MRPLDFAMTPKGSIVLITQVSTMTGELSASVIYVYAQPRDNKIAWWSHRELQVIGNLPRLLAKALAPVGTVGHEAALGSYGVER